MMKNIEMLGTGGKVDNSDPKAPKVINSQTLTSFSVGFYHYGEYSSKQDGYFRFSITKDDNGKLILKDGDYNSEGVEVGQDVLDGVREIINKYDLVKENGVNSKTYGLPFEFETCYLKAEYDSGEILSFAYDSDPAAEWSGEMKSYFATIYAEHGNTRYLPDPEYTNLVRFSLEYTDGENVYCFGEILEPKENKKKSIEEIVNEGIDEEDYDTRVSMRVYSRSREESLSEDLACISDDYYNEIFELINNTELMKYNNGKTFPGGFDYVNKKYYYEFYAEFEAGNTISGFSDVPDDVLAFMPIAEQFGQYYEEYIKRYPIEK